jgi:hypothetical protein
MYVGPINDSLRSLTSGLGTERDKGASGRFGGYHHRLSRDEVLDLYRSNFLAGRAVDVIADSCTEAWRSWSGTRQQVEAIEATERRLKLRSKLNEGMKM